MIDNTEKTETQAQLWTLLGPWAIACILLIVNIRLSQAWTLPLAAFSGLFLCYLWQWRGFALSSMLILAVFIYDLTAVSSLFWIWETVLSLSSISAFALATIGMVESRFVWDGMRSDMKQAKDSLSFLNGQQQLNQAKYQVEKDVLSAKVAQLESDFADKDAKLQSSNQLITLVREELSITHAYHEKLLLETYEARQRTAMLESELLAPSRNQSHPSELLHNQDIEIKNLQKELEEAREKERFAKQQAEFYANDLANRSSAKNELVLPSVHSEESEKIIKDLNANIEALAVEKKLLENALASIQRDLESLTSLEQKHHEALETHQASVHSLKASIERHEEELKLEQAKNQEQNRREQAQRQQLEEMTRKFINTSQQLGEWQNKAHEVASLQEKLTTLQSQLEADRSEKIQWMQQYNQLRRESSLLEEQYALALANEKGLKDQTLELTDLCNQLSRQNSLSEELLASHAYHKEELQAQVSSLAERCEQLDEQITQSEALLSQHISREEELQEQMANIVTRCEQLSYQLVQTEELRTHSLLKEKETHEKLVNITQRCVQLEDVEAGLKSASEQLKADCAQLQSEKEALAENIQQLQIENLSKLETAVPDRELRRIEGLYKQLRDQFAEKSSTLDATRRQLFLSEEKLAALQKEMEESRIYGEYEVENHLSSLLTSAEQELVGTERQYESEIQQLHEVIDRLIRV